MRREAHWFFLLKAHMVEWGGCCLCISSVTIRLHMSLFLEQCVLLEWFWVFGCRAFYCTFRCSLYAWLGGHSAGKLFSNLTVISMGHRYDSLLELPRLTTRMSSFLSCIFFSPSIWIIFLSSKLASPFFCFCAYVSNIKFFHPFEISYLCFCFYL